MRQVRKDGTLVILLAALSPLDLAKVLRSIDNADSQAAQRSHIVLHTQQRKLRSFVQQSDGGNPAPFAHHRKRGIGDHRKDRGIGRRVPWIIHQPQADLRTRSIDPQVDLVIAQQVETSIRIDRVQRKDERLEDIARSIGVTRALEERRSHRIDLRISFEKPLQLPERKDLPTFLQPKVLRVVEYRHHEREVAVLRSIAFQIPDQRFQKRRSRIVEEIRSRVVGLPALHGNDKGLHARAKRRLVGNILRGDRVDTHRTFRVEQRKDMVRETCIPEDRIKNLRKLVLLQVVDQNRHVEPGGVPGIGRIATRGLAAARTAVDISSLVDALHIVQVAIAIFNLQGEFRPAVEQATETDIQETAQRNEQALTRQQRQRPGPGVGPQRKTRPEVESARSQERRKTGQDSRRTPPEIQQRDQHRRQQEPSQQCHNHSMFRYFEIKFSVYRKAVPTGLLTPF